MHLCFQCGLPKVGVGGLEEINSRTREQSEHQQHQIDFQGGVEREHCARPGSAVSCACTGTGRFALLHKCLFCFCLYLECQSK